MALRPGHQTNFKTLLSAAQHQDLALVECQNLQTGEPVPVICAINYEIDGGISMVPLAQLFNDNPYDTLTPPS
ncbi:DUF6117 family protein [Lacunimicrobium album]